MLRFRRARAGALAAVLAVAGACGDDETDVSTASTTAAVDTGPTDPTTADPAPTSDAVPRSTVAVPAGRVVDVTFAGGRVTGGVRTETVSVGETVRLRVTSDVADSVHVHTYDQVAGVAPGQATEIDIEATIPGRHEVELEDRGRALIILEVR